MSYMLIKAYNLLPTSKRLLQDPSAYKHKACS